MQINQKSKRWIFLSVLGILGASLLQIFLAGKGAITKSQDKRVIETDKGTIREGQNL